MATFSFKPGHFFSVTKNPGRNDYTVVVQGTVTTDLTDSVGDVLMIRGVVFATDEAITGDREGIKETRSFYVNFIGKDYQNAKMVRPVAIILNHSSDIPKSFDVTLTNNEVSKDLLNEDLRDTVDPTGRDDFKVKVAVDKYSSRVTTVTPFSSIVHHDIPALT